MATKTRAEVIALAEGIRTLGWSAFIHARDLYDIGIEWAITGCIDYSEIPTKGPLFDRRTCYQITHKGKFEVSTTLGEHEVDAEYTAIREEPFVSLNKLVSEFFDGGSDGDEDK